MLKISMKEEKSVEQRRDNELNTQRCVREGKKRIKEIREKSAGRVR